MIKLLRKLATAMLPALLCGTLFIGCEADDKYTKVDDLFQPLVCIGETGGESKLCDIGMV